MQTFGIDGTGPAAALLHDVGVLAYPTEGGYGLGCDRDNRAALLRIFVLTRRPQEQGMLRIAASQEQMRPWTGDASEAAFARANAIWPGARPFIFPRSARVPEWIASGHPGITLRVTGHAPSATQYRAFGGSIVAASANRHGEAPARGAADMRRIFGDEPDGVLDAPLGGLSRPTPITDAVSGAIIRA